MTPGRVEEVTGRRQLERRRQFVGAVERDDHATPGSFLDRPADRRWTVL